MPAAIRNRPGGNIIPRNYNRGVQVPPVTVHCKCGERQALRYGERWECERCGTRWSTDQIPASEYQALTAAVRRYQLEALGFAAVMVAVFAPLMVIVDVRLGISGLILFFAWAFLWRPRRRRKLVLELRERARWQLRPE